MLSGIYQNGKPAVFAHPAQKRDDISRFGVPFRMPAQSKKQQMAAGAALSAKRGDKKKSELKGASKSMEESMSESQLEDLAHTKRKNLPKKKS